MRIGIDLGGSHIAIGLVNNEGQIIEKNEMEIAKKQEGNLKQDLLKFIEENIQNLVLKCEIEQIGIVAPGTPREGKLTNLVNLGLQEISVKELEEKYKLPIKLINDAKSAGLAEKKYGSLNGSQDCVFLCLGTGIGGAVFLNNQLLQANRNPGFELGHMIICKDGKQCNCGKKGCFETYCSIKRFKQDAINILNLDENLEANELVKILEQEKETSELKILIEAYIDYLLVGISNIIDIFEPQTICLGGSFVYFKEIFYDKLIEKLQETKYVFNKQELPKIVLAKLGNDAGMIGATL